MDKYKVIKAQYTDDSNQTINFTLLDVETKAEIPYGYHIGTNDQSSITLWLTSLLKNGEIKPDPYVKPILPDDELSAEIRFIRNDLLNRTDKYVSVPDYPLTDLQKEEIKQFRQALRDITNQSGFPRNVLWPVVPDCIKNEIEVP